MKTKKLKRNPKPTIGGSLKPVGSESLPYFEVMPEGRGLIPTAHIGFWSGILIQFHTSSYVGDDGCWVKVPTLHIPNDQAHARRDEPRT